MDSKLRIMDIDLGIGISLGKLPSHILAELDAGHWEGLVAALGFDLEALRVQHILTQIFHGKLNYRVLILLAACGACQVYYAEHLFECFKRFVHILVPALRLDIDGGLQAVHPEIAYVREPAAHICHQLLFKASTVQPLENYLAKLEKYNIVHSFLLTYIQNRKCRVM